jgi:hypothetical protein
MTESILTNDGKAEYNSDIEVLAVPSEPPAPLEGWKIFPIITSLWLGTMLVAIDNTIIGQISLYPLLSKLNPRRHSCA